MAIPKEQGGQGGPDKNLSGRRRAAALRVASIVIPGLDRVPPVSTFLENHPNEETAILQKLSDNPLLGLSSIFTNAETITSSSNLDDSEKASVIAILSRARNGLDLNQNIITSTVVRKPISDKAQAVKDFLTNLTTTPSNQVMQRLDSKARKDWKKGNLIRFGLLETTSDAFKLVAQQIREAGLSISDRALIRVLNKKGIALEVERLKDGKTRLNLILKEVAVKAVLDNFLKKDEEEKRAKKESETTKQVAGKV